MKVKTVKINEVWEIEIGPCRMCGKKKVRMMFGYCKKCIKWLTDMSNLAMEQTEHERS